jgi:pantoate--beta-alanine ligase
MIILKNPDSLYEFLLQKRKAGADTGFVPTMGALHEGHISLIKRSKTENEITICSIFVNPTQFNDPEDFKKYPITIETDIEMLESNGCDVLFLPSVNDIYPNGTTALPHYDLGFLETVLEGKFRPGHFQGVCQVVQRLLEIVMPHKLYLGQKDYQQCMVIKKMLELVGFQSTELIICPTLREEDGLAMSSRNRRLNADERKLATAISTALLFIKNNVRLGATEQIKTEASDMLRKKGFKTDYVEIADAETLQAVENWDGKQKIVALAAAFLNNVRLIDNMIINQ